MSTLLIINTLFILLGILFFVGLLGFLCFLSLAIILQNHEIRIRECMDALKKGNQ